ncbi:hypothetical protein MLD38_010214 [Melastoma candidum]|uniref:Uncharacterized protein n=1 Tax=Melastoma candidum TaxID=119954 RepID=A0ACB9QZ50_9MYRT|nr:hypothetical protein MLD38_010214 [Melastoma candidum]
MLSRVRPAAFVTAPRRLLQAQATRHVDDEGDWSYSSEWWGTGSPGDGHTLFRSVSDMGNGIVSVVAYPCSTPRQVCWPLMENWLKQRYMNIKPPGYNEDERFRILGYQWRVLRFNDNTRQSAVKLLAAYRESDPFAVSCMQQANCLAVPYLKSMVSAGLITLASCKFDLQSVVHGKKAMNVLCIGHGGGSLPLFLATKFLGAHVDIVEIDPLVISASTKAMGFPAFSMVSPRGDRVNPEPGILDQVMWKGVHERLQLFECDAEAFVQNNRLHPEHGTVVVNLHSDSDVIGMQESSRIEPILPMGKYVSKELLKLLTTDAYYYGDDHGNTINE